MAKRILRIQYVSNLHLELYDKAVFPLLVKPAARYLALAGDIGQPNNRVTKSFFDYASSHWDRVFYVPGRHEYGNLNKPSNIKKVDDALQALTNSYSNVTLLTREFPSYTLKEQVAIVGSTLWSHVPGKNVNKMTQYINELHAEQKDVMDAEIEYNSFMKTPVILLTHNVPCYSLISPRYMGDPTKCKYTSDSLDLVRPGVKAWIYGHTHNCGTAIINRAIVTCNARGGPNSNVPGFRPDTWLEIPLQAPSEFNAIDPLLVSAATGVAVKK